MTVVDDARPGDGLAMKTLGQRIKHARMQRPGRGPGGRMTQAELGDLVGINSNSVSRWERDVPEELTVEKIDRFASALHVRAEWLRSGAGPMHAEEGETLDRSEADDEPYVRDEALERLISDWTPEAQRDARDVRRSIGDEMTPDLLFRNLSAIARRHRLPVELQLRSSDAGLYVDRSDLGDEQRL